MGLETKYRARVTDGAGNAREVAKPPKRLIDNLGVKAGAKVWLFDVDDSALIASRERSHSDSSTRKSRACRSGRPRRSSCAHALRARSPAARGRVPPLERNLTALPASIKRTVDHGGTKDEQHAQGRYSEVRTSSQEARCERDAATQGWNAEERQGR